MTARFLEEQPPVKIVKIGDKAYIVEGTVVEKEGEPE